MEAYSIDLRERVVAAVDEAVETRAEIAERFGVSTSFIRKLLRRRRETGSIAPKPHAGGGVSSLTPQDLERVRTLVEHRPDATLDELCRGLREAGGSAAVRAWTMCRALRHRLRLPRKKSRSTPASGTRRAFGRCATRGSRRSVRSRRGSLFSWTRVARRPA